MNKVDSEIQLKETSICSFMKIATHIQSLSWIMKKSFLVMTTIQHWAACAISGVAWHWIKCRQHASIFFICIRNQERRESTMSPIAMKQQGEKVKEGRRRRIAAWEFKYEHKSRLNVVAQAPEKEEDCKVIMENTSPLLLASKSQVNK